MAAVDEQREAGSVHCMAVEKQLVECTVEECDIVRVWIDEQLRAADGSSWVNLEPIIPDQRLGDFTDRRGVSGWFSARGSDLPFVTIMGPDRSGKRAQAGSLGVQHGAGPKAVAQLAAQGVTTPETWVVGQEHTKRGLIYHFPESTDAQSLLDFSFAVAGVLSPAPLDAWWSAVRYQR